MYVMYSLGRDSIGEAEGKGGGGGGESREDMILTKLGEAFY